MCSAVKLTKRETEIMRLLTSGEGDSYKSVADALSISIKTVDQHIQRIHLKLGAQTTTQCILFFLKQSLRN